MRKEHRDIANRTDKQLKAEYDYLLPRLFTISQPALRRFVVLEMELNDRGLIQSATYSV